MDSAASSLTTLALFGRGQITLDVSTLFLVTIYVEVILGLLLLFAWAQNTHVRAVAWWGTAHILRAGSVALFGMYGSVSDLISIDFANAILFTTYALLWQGARIFNGRRAQPLLLIAGAVLWLALSRLPLIRDAIDLRFLLSAGIVTSYTWLTAYEFWRGRTEPLVSRWPMIFLLFAHGALFLLRTPLIAILPVSSSSQIFDSVWLTVLSFEALLFTIAIAFILLAMAKERVELRHKTAALVDPLTGIANRRAFLQNGDTWLKRYGGSKPTAILLLDLDHFKSINDRFGHAVGDRVLQVFAGTAQANLRAKDLIGRLGGEEFAAILVDANQDKARAVAEKIRAAFAAAALEVDGRPIGGTVSIGVTMLDTSDLDLAHLLAEADQALYCAKARGRNRVEVAGLDAVLAEDSAVAAPAGRLAEVAA